MNLWQAGKRVTDSRATFFISIQRLVTYRGRRAGTSVLFHRRAALTRLHVGRI